MSSFGRQQRTPRQDTRSRRNAARLAQAGQVGSGLTVNGLGQISIWLATDPGLEFNAGALRAKVAAPISRGASGIGLAFGTGLQNDGGILKTKDSEINHNNLLNTHNLTTDIDHNSITNTHNLTSDLAPDWANITGIPGTFTPAAHDMASHSDDDTYNISTTGGATLGGTVICNSAYGDVDFVIRKNTTDVAYIYDAGVDSHSFSGTVNFGTCVDAEADVDKFLVLDMGGNLDYRTGAEVLSDIGALSAATVIPQEVPETSSIRLGAGGGGAIADATGSTLLGYYAGEKLEDGVSCTFVGQFAGRYHIDGNYNTFVGGVSGYGSSGVSIVSAENSALGYASLYSITTGDNNTSLGRAAGYGLTTGSGNIHLGYFAGYRQTTADNLFIVDNQQRADVATEATNAILHGVMAALPANQTLAINAVTTLGVGSKLASDAAPTADAEIANKKYVDDNAGGSYTDEEAQDAVGGMVADTASINFTYTDGTPELKADVKITASPGDVTITIEADGLKAAISGLDCGASA